MLLAPLACGLLLAGLCMSQAHASITIAAKDTANPTLLYRGKPMFKFGPLPEITVFAVKWGSREFSHANWLDWMAANGLGYGRVYPESAYVPRYHNVDGRALPFEIVRWKGGRPIVDLTRFNPDYWDNVERVIKACAERGVVLQIQLYQRFFFKYRGESMGWMANYFHPRNNVNGFRMPGVGHGGGSLVETITKRVRKLLGGQQKPSGYDLWKAMTQDTVWRDIHKQWLEHILEAIGDNGNVIIDLMNEGSFDEGVSKQWIDYTLDIIEQWEQETGNELLVGMDFDHFYKQYKKTGDFEPLEYILSHPRLDVIIAEGADSHVVPFLAAGGRMPYRKALAVNYRERYRKPVISTNSPAYDALDDLEALHVYQWYALMGKVQGAGVYAKEYGIDRFSAPLVEYGERSRILKRFFNNLQDYAALEPAWEKVQATAIKHKVALVSANEVAVYLYTGENNKPVEKGMRLQLQSLALPDAEVSIIAVDPRTGRDMQWQDNVQDGKLATELPGFEKDLALHVVLVSAEGNL
jgi:hypothetical protein